MEVALFEKFRDIAYERAGIYLNDKKHELVSARVAKRQRALRIPSQKEYLHYLETDETGEEIVQFLDAISTNFTSFMREPEHFDILKSEVKNWIGQGRQRVRLWSTAASSGEEPYSIAITILEALDGKFLDFKVLCTDISTRMLNRATQGVYETDRLKPIPKSTRLKYFKRIGRRDSPDERWEVKPALREHLVFKRLNLAKPPFPMKGPLDVVFCRNVMIYFDHAVRQRLISQIERLLGVGGYLFTGHSETLTGLRHKFQTLRPSVYRKVKAEA